MAEKKKLGRGLNALLGDTNEDYAKLDKARSGKTVPIEHLRPGKYQPRHRMDATAIDTLAQSIRERGILQPLLVRRDPADTNSYEIIAGERRWRAAQLAKLHEVPVIIKDFDDQTTLEVAVIENVQRENLSPIEEADAYQRMIDEFGRTQEEVSQLVGKSRPHVANTLRLLALSQRIKDMVDTGKLTAGHARTLIGANDAEALADEMVAKALSVREAEKLVKRGLAPHGKSAGKGAAAGPGKPKDVDTIALERSLTNTLGLRVSIDAEKTGGRLIVHYDTLDQLDFVIAKLMGTETGGTAPTTPKPATAAKPATPEAAKPAAPAAPPAGEKPKLSVSLKPKAIRT